MIKALVEAVREVGRTEILPRARRVRAERKRDGSLFSAADTAAQAALIPRLQRLRDCPVIGEEMTRKAQRAAWGNGSGTAWCVDPVDGTTNFLQGIPYYAVSVALIEQGRARLAVVYNPAMDETFHAVAGEGAFVDGTRIAPRPAPARLAEAVASVELKRMPHDQAERLARDLPWYSYRNFGAAALDWCWLAAGRFDVYLHASHMLWDYAAGSLVLAEAGGVMSTFDADDFYAGEPWSKSVLAGREPRLFAEWRDYIRTRVRGRRSGRQPQERRAKRS
jgi:myo-inositol-1(or 4)-monophosphatase